MYTEFWWRNPKKRDNLEGPGIDAPTAACTLQTSGGVLQRQDHTYFYKLSPEVRHVTTLKLVLLSSDNL